MKKSKPKIIKDKKLRGEWAEMRFMTRAAENGLQVSKPWGEMSSYDFVVGSPHQLLRVQVKSTTAPLDDEGYVCTVLSGHRPYPAGSFDFLAAYVVPEDAWYIIPSIEIHGKGVLTLYPKSKKAKYEKFREAWHLLKEVAVESSLNEAGQDGATKDGASEEAPSAEAAADAPPAVNYPPASAFGRLQASMNYVKRYMEGNYPHPQKRDEPSQK